MKIVLIFNNPSGVTMNTYQFGDNLELQYFIEDMIHSGFQKDKQRTNDYATTYIHSAYPVCHVVIKHGSLSADVYSDNILLSPQKQIAA